MAADWVYYAAVAGVGIIAGLQQAEAQRSQSEFDERIANLNAKFKEYDAWEAEKYGYTQAARYQAVIDKTIGSQRVAYASQGVDVSYGTAAEVQRESKVTGFLNTLDILNEGRARALGLKREASNLRIQGFSARSQGAINAQAAQTSAIISGANTMLGYDWS